jgi:hypothetical protein
MKFYARGPVFCGAGELKVFQPGAMAARIKAAAKPLQLHCIAI